MSKPVRIVSWILQIVAAAILLQTLYFKFTGHPDSVAIFSQIGMEPEGRILVGVIELVIALLLLVPQTAVWGAILGFGNMVGALIAHITKIGFEGAHGELAAMAVLVAVACLIVLYLRRTEVPFVANMFANQKQTEAQQADKQVTRDQK